VGKPVTLFSGYSQKENRVTNYVLLVLKMLYEENPKYLGEVLAGLVGEDITPHVGVSFHQQEKRTTSVSDGLITQRAITVFIETKNWDWLYDDQLESHLAALEGENEAIKILLALGNFESDDAGRFERIRSICEQKYKRSIVFRAIGFDDFLGKVEVLNLPKNLSDAIADFRAFLDEENLLPSWKRMLDVVNCAGIPEDVTSGGVYMCPAEGGAYSHHRCRYFGMYRNKRGEFISEIEAVVDVDTVANTASIIWKNISSADGEVRTKAIAKVSELRPNVGPTRIFLLSELFPTNFGKNSPGGMQGSKQYFNVANAKAAGPRELAAQLNGRKWSEFA
jgi:hypothetical protein